MQQRATHSTHAILVTNKQQRVEVRFENVQQIHTHARRRLCWHLACLLMTAMKHIESIVDEKLSLFFIPASGATLE